MQPSVALWQAELQKSVLFRLQKVMWHVLVASSCTVGSVYHTLPTRLFLHSYDFKLKYKAKLEF